MPNTAGSSTAHVVTIGTNSQKGMNLIVADKDNNTALQGGTGITGESIPAVAGTLTAGTAGWNISSVVSADTTQNVTNAAMVATGSAIDLYEGGSAEEQDISMTYNFATAANQKAGVYSDIITYTVAVNN